MTTALLPVLIMSRRHQLRSALLRGIGFSLVSVFGHDLFIGNGLELSCLVRIPSLSGFFSPDAINLGIRLIEIGEDCIYDSELLDFA